MTHLDYYLTSEPPPSRWPVSGHVVLTIYRLRPSPLLEPDELAIEVEVVVADGAVAGPATLKGCNAVVDLTPDEQGEAVYLVELQ